MNHISCRSSPVPRVASPLPTRAATENATGTISRLSRVVFRDFPMYVADRDGGNRCNVSEKYDSIRRMSSTIRPENGRSNRLTIRQVADLAGVSTATVSRVINGRTDVSDRAREAVQRVVREHGYT